MGWGLTACEEEPATADLDLACGTEASCLDIDDDADDDPCTVCLMTVDLAVDVTGVTLPSADNNRMTLAYTWQRKKLT